MTTGWGDERLARAIDLDGFDRIEVVGDDELARLAAVVESLPGITDRGFFASHVDVAPASRGALDRDLRAVLEPVVARLRPGARVFATAVLAKRPVDGAAVRLHQDLTYTDEAVARSWVLWIPLDRVDARSGRFHVVSGSHRWSDGIRPGGPGARAAEELSITLEGRTEALDLRRGEGLVWDAALIHGSEPNTSTLPRYAVSAAFVDGDDPVTYFHLDADGLRGYRVPDDHFVRAERPFFEEPVGCQAIEPWRPVVEAGDLAAAAGVSAPTPPGSSPIVVLDPLERAVEGERVASYALIEHRPLTPVVGKLRSSTVLFRHWDEIGVLDAMAPLVEAVRAEFGVNGTAWGIKQSVAGMSAELYWYFHGDRRPLTGERVASVLDAAGFSSPELPPGDRSWYSISVDLAAPDQDPRALGAAHVYVSHAPATPRSALSYRVDGGGLILENAYYLFDPVADRAALEGFVEQSPIIADAAAEVLLEELLPCDHVAFVHKPTVDGLYYGGVDVDGLAWFLDRLDMAPHLRDHVRRHGQDLDHLLFDVGLDLQRVGGALQAVKAGIYGTL